MTHRGSSPTDRSDARRAIRLRREDRWSCPFPALSQSVIARSFCDEAIQRNHAAGIAGLLRFARNDEIYYFFGSTFSTGAPASRHAVKPPPRCATGLRPISCAVLAASAERQPDAQWKTNFLSCWKIGLA